MPKKSENRKIYFVKNGDCDLDGDDDSLGGVNGHWEVVKNINNE